MHFLIDVVHWCRARVHILTVFLAALLCVVGSPMAHSCPVQLPASLRSVQVGDIVRVNGLEMAIQKVRSGENIQAVFAQAEQLWQADGFGSKRSVNGRWQVLTSLSETCLATLQLDEHGGVSGYFARTVKDPSTRLAMDRRAPVPPGATVTSQVASEDDGRKGQVLTLTSSISVGELNKFFAAHLSQSDWSPPRLHTVKNKATGREVVFISAQRKREQIDIVLWADRLTQIVMTVSEAL